jgi:flagellar biosynthesis/type III secretory pathway M-ring protein FliF/YscJ
MPTFLSDILRQLNAISARLDAGQRMTIAAVLLATAVGIGAIIWYSSQPTMMVLTSGEDAHIMEVEKALQDSGVLYQRVGRQIMVDRSDHSRAQSALSLKGVSASSAEEKSVFDSMTSSAEDRAASRLRRLQKDAARALMGMQGVREALVSASKPKRSVFQQNDRASEPRATALVRVAPGVSFQRVARSAVETVASTIGLPPENVTIIDMVTKATFRLNPDSPNTDGSGFRRQERELEAVYEEKALRLLGPLQDKVRVAVVVFLDPEYTSARKSYIPPEPVVTEESSTKEDKKGAVKTVGGDPSVTNAVTGNQTGPGTSSSHGDILKRTTREKKYDSKLGTIVEGLMAPKIKKLTLALTIDESLQGQKDDIKAVVMNAIGWEEGRDGPKKEVQPFIFKFPPEVASAGVLPDAPGTVVVGPSEPSSWMQYLPIFGQLLGLGLVLLFLKSLLKRSAVTPMAMGARTADAVRDIKDLDDENLPPEEAAKAMRREIERAIGEDPATISRMLERWLAEQKA